MRLLIAAYLVEAGLVLAVAPWTVFWDRNALAHAWPWLGAIMFNAYTRGAVTGIGLVTMAAGLRDLAAGFAARRQAPPGPSVP